MKKKLSSDLGTGFSGWRAEALLLQVLKKFSCSRKVSSYKRDILGKCNIILVLSSCTRPAEGQGNLVWLALFWDSFFFHPLDMFSHFQIIPAIHKEGPGVIGIYQSGKAHANKINVSSVEVKLWNVLYTKINQHLKLSIHRSPVQGDEIQSHIMMDSPHWIGLPPLLHSNAFYITFLCINLFAW